MRRVPHLRWILAIGAIASSAILMSGVFLWEEAVLVALLPAAASLVVNGTLAVVARIRGRPTDLRSVARKESRSVAVFTCLIALVVTWAAQPVTYDREAVEADLDDLPLVLEQVHPDLYHTESRAAFAEALEREKTALPPRVTDRTLYRAVARLTARFGDGHTRVGGGFFGRRMRVLLLDTFPYGLRVDGDRVWVTESYGHRQRIPPGSDIVSVNGLDASAFVRAVAAYHPIEKRSDADRAVENPFTVSAWNDFGSYDVAYVPPGGSGAVRVRARGGLVARLGVIRSFLRGTRPPYYTFEVLDGGVGYLQVFAMEDLEAFDAFLRRTFDEIGRRGIEDLVIDVRRNQGGNSALADALLQYIASDAFRTMDGGALKVSQQVLDAGLLDWLEPPLRVTGTLYTFPEASITALEANPLRFGGTSYLLVGPKTYSSAVILASAFQCNGIGPVIGSESGGKTVAFGDVFTVRLPRTGQDVDVSWKRFEHACGLDDGRGVVPDFLVAPESDATFEGDPVLNRALQLVSERRLQSVIPHRVRAGPAHGRTRRRLRTAP